MHGQHGAKLVAMDVVREGFTATSPRIRYWQAGTGGPRVLLIMGFGMQGEIWRPQVDDLSRDHQVAFFDNRGIGESETDKRLWTMADMARDAVRVAEQLGWDDFHLAGVSMGGMVAQELACNHPERVKSLTLIATHEGGANLQWLPSVRALNVFLRANSGPREQRLDALRELLYPSAFLASVDPEAMQQRMSAQLGKPAPKSTILGQLHAILRHSTGPRLAAFRAPTLIIKPGQDILIPPRNSDRLRRRLAHARLLEIEDAGHGAVFQSAPAINRALREHIGAAEPRRATDEKRELR
ncbi:MAG: hypothetical protein CMN30_16090 [Sandaracinus sp.]|nr:hypothetical protein [Sandaracinus sp.]|tara:strand:+ start:426 stop:1316 length:891 start_codon:yes stop_codon:yes gene_type:complete